MVHVLCVLDNWITKATNTHTHTHRISITYCFSMAAVVTQTCYSVTFLQMLPVLSQINFIS